MLPGLSKREQRTMDWQETGHILSTSQKWVLQLPVEAWSAPELCRRDATKGPCEFLPESNTHFQETTLVLHDLSLCPRMDTMAWGGPGRRLRRRLCPAQGLLAGGANTVAFPPLGVENTSFVVHPPARLQDLPILESFSCPVKEVVAVVILVILKTF